MKAVILSAGLGTRIRPLTNKIPKCLIEIGGKTLIKRQVDALKICGIKDIFVVVGGSGECWREENYEKIKSVNVNTITNPHNLKTKNTFSLRLAIKSMRADDILVIDGDLLFSKNLIRDVVKSKKNLILSKESYVKNDPRNKIIIDNSGKVTEMGKDISKEKLILPYFVYGALIKIKKDDFYTFKAVVEDEVYEKSALDKVINVLCERLDLYKITDNRWVNINNMGELKEAEEMVSKW